MDSARELLDQQVTILCDGWSERREYAVSVNSHIEYRVDRITHHSLITQLRNMTHPLVRPKSADSGGSCGKPGSKPPGAFQAAALLDEIRSYAYSVVVRWSDAPNKRHLRRTTLVELQSLHNMARVQGSDDVREVAWHLAKFIRQAKVILGHEAPTRAFDSTVCGTCGGQLRVAIDGVGDVFCAGTPSNGACGTRYTQQDIIRLAMEA